MKKTLPNRFIAPRLRGRTGNMLFQIAHAYTQSLKNNIDLLVPANDSSSSNKISTIFRNLNFDLNSTHNLEIEHKVVTAPFHYNEINTIFDKTVIFEGWYQSEKYFEDHASEVRNLFAPSDAFKNEAYSIYPFLKDKTVAALNVRRGDYLEPAQSVNHPVVSLGFIKEAYKKLPPHDVLLVMSDGIEWCKENLNFPNMVFSDNSKFWDDRGVWLLSLCDHFIISNSTFSWWGAWLSRNESKTVIAPSTWFGPGLKDLKTDDLYCSGWIKIPTEYRDGYIELKSI